MSAAEGAPPPSSREQAPPLAIAHVDNENAAENARGHDAGHTATSAATSTPDVPPPRCLTCRSAQNCEEDTDNPGEYYCGPCWEEYAALADRQSQGMTSNNTKAAADDEAASPATSQFLTPRGMSLHTQGDSQEDREGEASATPPSQLLQTQGLSPGLTSSSPDAGEGQGGDRAPNEPIVLDKGAAGGQPEVSEEGAMTGVEETGFDGVAVEKPDAGDESSAADKFGGGNDNGNRSRTNDDGARQEGREVTNGPPGPEEGGGGAAKTITWGADRREEGARAGGAERTDMEGDDGHKVGSDGTNAHNDNDAPENDDGEDDDWVGTQEDMFRSSGNDTGMGSGMGLLTQAVDDSDGTDDDDGSVAVKEAGMDGIEQDDDEKVLAEGGNATPIIKGKELPATGAPPGPIVVEAVTAHHAHDKDMTLSGLTEPSQAVLIPRDKLPRFAAIGDGGPGPGEEVEADAEADATVAEPPKDGTGAAPMLDLAVDGEGRNDGTTSDHSVGGSSAYRGLTEEEDADDAAAGNGRRSPQNSIPTGGEGFAEAKERPSGELVADDSNPQPATNAGGECGEPQNRGQGEPSALANETELDEKNNDDGRPESDHDDDIEGTGDTLVTTGSGTAAWSLYEGETQTLPTGPSQVVAGVAAPNEDCDNGPEPPNSAKDVEMDLRGEDPASIGGQTQKNESAMPDRRSAVEGNLEDEENLANRHATDSRKTANGGAGNDLAAVEDGAEDPFSKETQELDKPLIESEHGNALGEDGEEKRRDELIVDEGGQAASEHDNVAWESLKHTPENGALPISYPTDHLENNASPAKEAPVEKPQDVPPRDTMDEDETQLSQDLLAASPAKSNSPEEKPPTAAAAAPNDNLDGPQSEDKINLNEHDDALEPGNAAETGKPTPKSPSRRKGADETTWMSSTRHLHGNQETSTSPGGSSPRLLMPSFKPDRKHSDDEPKRASSDEESDQEPWSGRGHSVDNDSIENTQDDEVPQPSVLKRLSRGTTSRSSVPGPSGGGSETKSVIKPKVLRYEAVAKHDGDDNDESSAAASDSSSEAEFEDEFADDDAGQFQQSQTDRIIRRQLKEVRAMELPSAEEIEQLASRQRLADEIAELEEFHQKEVSKLWRKNKKLMTQLSEAEDAIKQKDRTIKQKNALLHEQSVEMEKLRDFVSQFRLSTTRERVKPQEGAATKKTSTMTTKHTPLPAKKKRKKSLKKPLSSDSDSSDDDEVPLSTLKNAGGSSKSKRRRKSYGKHANGPSPKKAERALSPKTATISRPGDTSSVETTPTSNRSGFTPDVWRILKSKGWKYKTGPEPFNSVYVPKDGAVHAGTQPGIHFFESHQVVDEAVKRGDLPNSFGKASSPEESSKPTTSELQPSKKSHETPHYPGHTVLTTNDAPLDDTRLCGESRLLTLESAKMAIDLAAAFVRQDDRFVGSFFQPLWNRLKAQGAASETESDINWGYEPYRNVLSERNWCFVPPASTLGAKGKLGKDYYLTEEQVVLCVLKEVKSMNELTRLYENHAESFATLLPILTRAVEENMDYNDAKLGKSATVRTRRAKNAYQPGEDSPAKSSAKGKSPQLKKGGQSPKKRERASKITPETKGSLSSTKKQKTAQLEEDTSPSFHTSQTQSEVAVPPSYSRRSPGQNSGPLSGYSFFYSSIDPKFCIDEKIKRLGGKIVRHDSLTIESSRRKVFFLGDHTSWRKTKHILACSLGVPLLHHTWLVDLEKKFQEHGTAKVFDSELFIKYRLPLGLNLSSGYYPLQRASNARSWDGGNVFGGMTIALAIDPAQENEWKMILRAGGADVKTLSDVQRGKGKISADCCLFASTSLPPHTTSEPVYVSNMLKNLGDDVPRMDLAWAHQSIIQRKCLPIVDNARYVIPLGQIASNAREVYSIKSKGRGSVVRYEVGDLVQFSRGPKSTSRGRIIGIIWEKQGKGCKLRVKLLDSNGDFELVDCPSSAEITVDESSLQGNILLLSAREFYKLGYLPKNPEQTNIFNRVLPSNESQM